MGGGVSSQNIDKNQKLLLAKSIRNKYDDYVLEGISDDIILERILNDYSTLLGSLPLDTTTQSSNNLIVDNNNKNNNTSCEQQSSSSTSSPIIKSKKMSTRRRSFDNINLTRGNVDPPAPLFNSISQSKSLSSSSIIPSSIIPSSSSNAKVSSDSWESISQQPYCNVCAMAFKTSMFLARHIKYSDQHARNLKNKLIVVEAPSTPPTTDTVRLIDRTSENSSPQDEQKDSSIISIDNHTSALLPPRPSSSSTITTTKTTTNVPPTSSLEGVHYKLLYGGSKFFWMSDKEIDLSIYQFFEEPSTIEIIPYDLDLNKELPRIYLNLAAIILPMLNNNDNDVDDDHHHGATNAAERRDQELTRFIISRLHLTTQPIDIDNSNNNNNNNNSEFNDSTPSTSSPSSSYIKQVIFLNNSIDPINITNPLLSSPPSSLIPVKVTRRRNTIGELIEETKINRRNTCGNLVEEMQIEIITQSSSNSSSSKVK